MKSDRFGAWLKKHRKQTKPWPPSQEQAAEYIGVTEDTYRKMENQRGMNLSRVQSVTLAQCYGMADDEIWQRMLYEQRTKVRKRNQVIGEMLRWYQDQLDEKNKIIKMMEDR